MTAYVEITTLEGGRQFLALGPVASQESIKLLGGDGGGFFNTNSAHPFENPTALTSSFEMLLIFMIGAALTNTFGRMVRDERQGWALFAAMTVLFLAGTAVVYGGEAKGNPASWSLGIDQAAGPAQAGGNMEGKEVRFGPVQSALFAMVSTSSSDGAVNAMHDSFMPLPGAVLMINMKLGEVIFGGPGSGLFSMLLLVLLAVFVAGLMIGRAPEYLGKKIEADEIKMAMLALLITPAFILGAVAIAAVLPQGLSGPANEGPHGFSEILYAYTSAAATNGSAFAGLSANNRVLQPHHRGHDVRGPPSGHRTGALHCRNPRGEAAGSDIRGNFADARTRVRSIAFGDDHRAGRPRLFSHSRSGARRRAFQPSRDVAFLR